jgi:predicted permease
METAMERMQHKTNLLRNLERLIDSMSRDVRFALRQILRQPGFSTLVVLTLAVGIGASAAIFSVLKGVVLRDLPYADPERLVAVWESPLDERWHQPFTSPDYFDVREQSRTLDELGVLSGRWFNLSGEGAPLQLRGAGCTASLLRLLGVPPLHGRFFTDDEEVEGNHRVLVLSHGLWRRHFGGEPDVVGRTIAVDGMPHEVIGIMPERFEFPTPWGGRDNSQLWAPLVLSRDDSERSSHRFGAVGRLEEGVTAAEVEAELKGIAAQLAEAYPNTNARTSMYIEPMMQRTLGDVREALIFLLIVVGLVLLIACANVAGMLLARGAQRLPELAIRGSMGAGRHRILRQLLTESLILSLLGGSAGFLLAYWGVGALGSIIPDNVPRVAGVEVDTQVLGFAAGTTILAGLLFGLAPALFASRIDLATVLKEGRAGRGGSRGRNRFLATLVAVQFATGLILVNAAVLLVVSYINVISQDMNFDTDEVVVAGISLSGPAYEKPYQRRAFYDELLAQVRSLPGVVQAGVTSKLPLMGGNNGGVLVNDEVFDPQVQNGLVEYSFVDEGYLEAMGIGLLSGRTLNQGDLEESSVAAVLDVSPVELPLVINRTMAEQMWPGENALGKLVRPNSATESYRARVVGIVEDVMQWGAEREPLPEMYFPHTAEVWGPLHARLVVRAAADPDSLVGPIRAVVRDIDDQIPVAEPSTMAEVRSSRTGRRRFSMLMVGLFAAASLILIVAGTYGVMSYAVSQRTHEIGVRVALGADKARVFRHFLARAGRLLAPGLLLGLAGAVAASALTRSMVFGVSALNPLYVAAAVGVMMVVAFAAILVPVLRATGVDPVRALRTE